MLVDVIFFTLTCFDGYTSIVIRRSHGWISVMRSYQLMLTEMWSTCQFFWLVNHISCCQSAAPQDGTPGIGEHICSLISVHRFRAPLSYLNRLLYPTVVSVVFYPLDKGGVTLIHLCELLMKTEVYLSKHVKVKKITSTNICVCDQRKLYIFIYL